MSDVCDDYPLDDWDDDRDMDDPIGSCDECGVNVYVDSFHFDGDMLCDQCAFMLYGP